MTNEEYNAFEAWKKASKEQDFHAVWIADWLLEHGCARESDIEKYRRLSEIAAKKWQDLQNESRKDKS